MSAPDPGQRCLQCGDTRASIKATGYICGIMSGGESDELVEDWPTHRWADWGDKALAGAGIKSEAFHKYRRTYIWDLQWVACDDTVRGHILSTKASDKEWFGTKIGQCITCHHTPETETTP